MKIEKSTKSDIALAIFLNLYKIIYYYIFTLVGIDDYVALVIVGLYTTQSIILTLDRWEMENTFNKLDSHLDDCHSLIDSLEEDAKEFRKEFNTSVRMFPMKYTKVKVRGIPYVFLKTNRKPLTFTL